MSEKPTSPEQLKAMGIEEVGEKEEFNQEMVTKEKTLLEKLRGRSKDIAKVLILVTALSIGGVARAETGAEKTPEPIKTEEVAKEQKAEIINIQDEINKIMEGMEKDLSQSLTAQDSVRVYNHYERKLVNLYFDNVAGVNLGFQGEASVRESLPPAEDCKALADAAEKMQGVSQEVLGKEGGRKVFTLEAERALEYWQHVEEVAKDAASPGARGEFSY